MRKKGERHARESVNQRPFTFFNTPPYHVLQRVHDRPKTMAAAASSSGISASSAANAALRRAAGRRGCSGNGISSFGFSGAGFLVSYHLGAAKCLIDHGLLPHQDETFSEKNVKLIGVSGGALLSAAVAVGVDMDDGMQTVLDVSRRTRALTRTGLDVLEPGFSLVDVAEEAFIRLLKKSGDILEDNEKFLRRVQGGEYVRIGLTDRRIFPPVGHNPRAFCYADKYRDVDDLLAACILSSYIPIVTGPAWGTRDARNGAVARAALRLQDMIESGCVRYAGTGLPLEPLPRFAEGTPQGDEEEARLNPAREICWDGGLVNAFPLIDEKTVLVSPLAGDFLDVASITPALEYSISDVVDETDRAKTTENTAPPRYIEVNPYVRIHVTRDNARALRLILMSSDDDALQSKFAQGYDNARRFLDRKNLLNVFQR